MIRIMSFLLLGFIAFVASYCESPQLYISIAPPIQDQEPKYLRLSFNAEDGGVLYSEIGSVIQVPANAFVDSLGNIVEGEVELQFREFSDAENIFLSGIPMEVSQKSKDQVLSSASMWEIRASQKGKQLVLDSANNKTISTTIASDVGGNEYDLWHFDEASSEWINISNVEPEANPEVGLLKESNDEAKKNLEKLDLSNCFVLNFYGLLDVYKPQDNTFDYYYRWMDEAERTAYIDKLKAKATGYKMQWILADNDYADAVYYGKQYPASMIVWETERKLPNKVKRLKEGNYRAEQIGRHRYRITFLDKNYKEVYSTTATIKMPIKDLYRVGAENWIALRDSMNNQLQLQEARLATLGTVRRTFEIDQLGIFNYDKLLDQEETLQVFASLTVDGHELQNKDELMLFCYMEEDRSVIRYYYSELNKFILYPGSYYKLFCVTGPGKFAYLPDEQLKELVKLMPVLKGTENPQIKLSLISYGKELHSAEEFRQFLNSDEEDVKLVAEPM